MNANAVAAGGSRSAFRLTCILAPSPGPAHAASNVRTTTPTPANHPRNPQAACFSRNAASAASAATAAPTEPASGRDDGDSGFASRVSSVMVRAIVDVARVTGFAFTFSTGTAETTRRSGAGPMNVGGQHVTSRRMGSLCCLVTHASVGSAIARLTTRYRTDLSGKRRMIRSPR